MPRRSKENAPNDAQTPAAANKQPRHRTTTGRISRAAPPPLEAPPPLAQPTHNIPLKQIAETIYDVTVRCRTDMTMVAATYGIKRQELINLLAKDVNSFARNELLRGRDAIYDQIEAGLLEGSLNPKGGTSYAASIFALKAKRGWSERQRIEVSGDGYRKPGEGEGLDSEDVASWVPRVIGWEDDGG